ncbi:hypothetical protein PGT21_027538 [Puccinia graminis f. sp. tritici]|uniref:Uncharacterized protein n=1 Tax=Puccinia graminis f. sp. tritici TaxID=56615 RepID=A0A5B0QYT3_PUCGR|nr:hypothetical protein PGT21_027538 [Puccinia graminis f. sp. tritici]
MIFFTQLNSWPHFLFILLTFVYRSDSLIPRLQEGIETDPTGAVLHEIPAIPTTRLSSDDVRNAAQGTYFHQFNNHPVYLLRPSLPADQGYRYSADASNRHTAFVSESPVRVVTTRVTDGISNTSARSSLIDPGPLKASLSHPGPESPTVTTHGPSMQQSFDAPMKQRMLESKPFVPASQAPGKGFQSRASFSNDNIRDQGKDSMVAPKQHKVDIDQNPNKASGNELRDQAGQGSRGNERANSKVLYESKASTGSQTSTSFDYAIHPERLDAIKNFIRQFKSDVASPDTSDTDNFSESNRSNGSNEFLPEISKVATSKENTERGGTPASLESLSSFKSSIPSESQQRPRALNEDEIRRAKNRQKRLRKQERRIRSQLTASKDTSAKVQSSEKTEKVALGAYDNEFPSLASSSEESSAVQLGKSSYPNQQESKNEEVIPNNERKEKQGDHQNYDQTIRPTRSHGSSEYFNTRGNLQPTISSISRRKGVKGKGSLSERPSESPSQPKRRAPEPLQPSSNILEQKDPQVKEKILSLLGIEQAKNVKPALEKKTHLGTPPNNQKVNDITDLSKQVKKEVAAKATRKLERDMIKSVAEQSSNRLIKSSLQKTSLSSVEKSIENLEHTNTKSATGVEDKRSNFDNGQNLFMPQDSASEPEDHSRISTNPNTVLALKNKAAPNLPQSQSIQLMKGGPTFGGLPPRANQIPQTDPLVISSGSKTLQLKEQLQEPLIGAKSSETSNNKSSEKIKTQLHQSNPKKEEAIPPGSKETVKGPETYSDTSESHDQPENHSISKSGISPTKSNPSSVSMSNPHPMTSILSASDDISPSKISRQIVSSTSKDIRPLNNDVLHNVRPADSNSQAPSSSIASGSRKANSRSDLLHLPPNFTTDIDNHQINHNAIISLEDAFGEQASSKNSKTRNLVWQSPFQKKVKTAMLPLGIYLRISNLQAHSQVGFITEEGYQELYSLWKKDSYAYEIAESGIRDAIGTFEGTRRMLALRRQILHYTISQRWIKARNTWFDETTYGSTAATGFETLLGLSSEPFDVREIPLSSTLARSRKEKWEAMPHSLLIWGQAEMERQIEMRSYLAQRVNPFFWWEAYDLNMKSKLFGLDILTILKVGDSLQFGANFVIDRGYGRVSIDSAYALLLKVMTDTNRPLPWIESSERAWLYSLPDGLYEQRLQRLSQLISDSRPQMNPLSVDILAKKIDQNFIDSYGYRMGEELLWIDKGLPLDELLNQMKTKTPVVSDRLLLPQPKPYLTLWEFKDILLTSAHYFWNSFKYVLEY